LASILCIDTATQICSVCIAQDGSLLAQRETEKKMSHTSLTSVFVQELAQETGIAVKDLDAVAVSGGPGSYTGLRVGISVAKGICSGAGIPLIAINTLEALGKASIEAFSHPKALHISMIDARRMEVYLAAYQENGHCIQENTPYIVDEHSFSDWLKNYEILRLSGDGAEKVIQFLGNPALKDSGIRCSAANLIKPAFARLNEAKFEDLAYYSPNYIKSPNITQRRKALF